MKNKETYIKVNNLNYSYDSQLALKNISFEIKKGEYIGITGPNGGGKSTLINIILGLIDVPKNKVEFSKDISLGDISFVPQLITNNFKVFPATVNEIVLTGLTYKKGRFKTKEKQEKVDKVLKYLGIESIKNKMIGDLSGGQKQKVLIARAIVSEPKILILDEPTSALDKHSRAKIYNMLDEMRNNGKTIIHISHDIGSIECCTDRVLVIDTNIEFFGDYSKYSKESLHEH